MKTTIRNIILTITVVSMTLLLSGCNLKRIDEVLPEVDPGTNEYLLEEEMNENLKNEEAKLPPPITETELIEEIEENEETTEKKNSNLPSP